MGALHLRPGHLLVAALVLASATAAAEPVVPFPYQLRLGFAWTRGTVPSAVFSGMAPSASGPGQPQRAMGADVGFVHPSLFGAEAEATACFGELALFSVVGGFGFGGGPDAYPRNPVVAQGLPPGDFREWRLALAPGVHGRLRGTPVDVQAEARLGVLSQSFPVLGVQGTCAGVCTDSVGLTRFLLEPEVRAAYDLGEGFQVGAFVGTEAAPEPFHHWTAGLDLALAR